MTHDTAHLTNPHNYFHIQIPNPIAQCRELSDFQKVIYGTLNSARMSKWKHSMSTLADAVRAPIYDSTEQLTTEQLEDLHADRDNVRRSMRRAMDGMEEGGFIKRHRRRNKNGTQVVDVELFIPESIHASAKKHLFGAAEVEENDAQKGGTSSPSHGGDFKSGTGGTSSPSPLDQSKISSKINTAPQSRSIVTPRGEEGEEEITTNLDGGSQTAAQLAENRITPRVAKPGGGTNTPSRGGASGRTNPRVKVLAKPPSGKECLRTPSKRWELTRWRDLPAKEWRAQDVIGYWVCQFLEVCGHEDGQFFNPDVHAMAKDLRNVKRFVEIFHDGAFISVKGVVDKILERAEDLGMPCSLRFFMTPSNEGNVRRLDEKRPQRKREKTLREKNDEGGSDRAYWDSRPAITKPGERLKKGA